MKKIAIIVLALPFLAFPAVSSAAQLTPMQANAIIGVLIAFNADTAVIQKVRAFLFPMTAPASASSDTMAPVPGALPTINTIPMQENKSGIVVSLAHKAPADVKNDLPFGSFILKVQVLDASGKPVNGAAVSMKAPDNIYGPKVNKKTDTTTDLQSKDYYVQFEYVPTKKGRPSIELTSDNLVNTLVLDVE